MAKSATFGVMHLGIAFGVTYTLTGSLSVAGAVTLVEPLCNTVAHYFFDRWWDRKLPAGNGSTSTLPIPSCLRPERALTSATA